MIVEDDEPDPQTRCYGIWWKFHLVRLHRRLMHLGNWYVEFDGREEQILHEAVRHVPLRYRWLGYSLDIEELDGGGPRSLIASQWLAFRQTLEPNDKIWPFVINPYSMAMRAGYVVVRKGKAVSAIVALVS